MDRTLTKKGAQSRPLVQDCHGKRLRISVFVDIDGSLAGFYQKGARCLRPDALPAIKMLAEHAPVFLWSIVGADNGERLIREFPKLEPYIAGCYGKDNFPLHMVEHPYCIDDEEMDAQVVQSHHIIVDTYYGGPDSGLLMEAASTIVDHISRHFPGPSVS